MSINDEDERVKFTIYTTTDAKDSKTTVILIYSIEVLSGPNAGIYGFAPEQRSLRNHEALCKLPVIAGMIRAMKARGQIRRGLVKLTPEVRKLYFDEDDNVVFMDDYLEETTQLEKPKPATNVSQSNITQAPVPVAPPRRSLQSIMKDAVISKFNEEKTNALIWLESFEQECGRLAVEEKEFPQALKLFLEGTAIDWYEMNLILLQDQTWTNWRKEFVENFTAKGWSQSKYAINFKYIGGNVSEYVRKKLKLLAETNKTLPEEWRILMVIAGLPDDITSKIKRDRATSVNALVAEISQLKKPALKNAFSKSSVRTIPKSENSRTEGLNNQSDRTKYQSKFRPCRICEKAGKPGRYHPESECFTAASSKTGKTFTNTNFKFRNSEQNVKVTNNTEIKNALNNEDVPKN
jgi:hypothetical protein